MHERHVRAVQRRQVQAPAALPPVPVPAHGGMRSGVDRGVVQPRMQDVEPARRGIRLHVGDEGAHSPDVVAGRRIPAAQTVRLHRGRAATAGRPGAQIRPAVAGVDGKVRRPDPCGRPDRARHVVCAGRGRDGVDHPLQFRGGAALDRVHVGPLLRRGVHRAVLAYLDRNRLVGQRGGSQQGAGRRVVRDHARVGVVPDDRVQYPGLRVKRHVASAVVGQRRGRAL